MENEFKLNLELKKVGNSNIIRIPAAILKQLEKTTGDKITVIIKGGK